MTTPSDIRKMIEDAFPSNAAECELTLRQGNEIDGYYEITPKTPEEDFADWKSIPDSYLAKYECGLGYLDTGSWLFYLPAFMCYALDHYCDEGGLVVDRAIWTLRPRIPAHRT
jgi:hypothetical protein